jgi:hypothetical protein
MKGITPREQRKLRAARQARFAPPRTLRPELIMVARGFVP